MFRLFRSVYMLRATRAIAIRRSSSSAAALDSAFLKYASTGGCGSKRPDSKCCRLWTTVSTNFPGAERPSVPVATSLAHFDVAVGKVSSELAWQGSAERRLKPGLVQHGPVTRQLHDQPSFVRPRRCL